MPDKTVLSASLWDLRASVESQLRYLTEIQRRRRDQLPKAEESAQRGLSTKTVHDLKEVQRNNVTIARIVEYTIEQAQTELGTERPQEAPHLTTARSVC